MKLSTLWSAYNLAAVERDTAEFMRDKGASGIAVGTDTLARQWQRRDRQVRKLNRIITRRIEQAERAEKASTAVSEFGDELRRMGV